MNNMFAMLDESEEDSASEEVESEEEAPQGAAKGFSSPNILSQIFSYSQPAPGARPTPINPPSPAVKGSVTLSRSPSQPSQNAIEWLRERKNKLTTLEQAPIALYQF
jgi:hypothetical protein